MRKSIREYGMYIALAVIMLVFTITTNGNFITPANLSNLLNQCAYIAVLAIGMTLVIIIKHIDLSVGYVAGFLGAVAALVMKYWGWHPLTAILFIVILGAVIGFGNGLLVARVGVPAFVVTLAGMLVFHGALQLATEKTGTIGIQSEFYNAIGDGYIPEIASITVFGQKLHLLTLIIGVVGIVIFCFFQIRGRNDKIKYNLEVQAVHWFVLKMALMSLIVGVVIVRIASHRGMPWSAVVVAVVLLIYNFIMNKTTLGRHIYGVGGNTEAAALSGVSVVKVTVFVFASMSALAAVSGMLYSARLHSATTTAGAGFELDAIASCYVGGVSASGGVGKVTNSIIGAMVMASLINGMKLMGTGESYQYIFRGAILVLAVVFDLSTKRIRDN